MEEQIKRAVRNLNIGYVFFWVFPAFLLGAGEFDLLPVGNLVDNVQATYYFETIGNTSFFEAIQLGAQKENRQYDYHASTETLCAMEHCPIGNT